MHKWGTTIAVTTRDIARLAGVSVSTVSRSLNDSPRISSETKDRIKKIATDLDFEFNASARSLSTHRSGTVAFVVPAFLDQFANTLYLNLLIYEIRERLSAQGLDCIVTEAVSPGGSSNIRRLVLQRKVDGIILLLESNTPDDWSLIKKRGLPVIHVHYMPRYIDTESIDYFFTDNVAGGFLATKALLDSGSRRLACIIDVCNNPEMSDRKRGFVEAHEALSLAADPRLCLVSVNSFQAAYACVASHWDLLKDADGFFVATDIMALAVLRALHDRGRKVPQEVRVVGYDDVEIGGYFSPSLTSVHQPREEIARLTCSRLADLLEGRGGGHHEQLLLPPTLTRRESC